MIVMTEPVTTGGKNRISLAEVRRDEEGEQAGDDHRAVDDEQAVGAAAVGQRRWRSSATPR